MISFSSSLCSTQWRTSSWRITWRTAACSKTTVAASAHVPSPRVRETERDKNIFRYRESSPAGCEKECIINQSIKMLWQRNTHKNTPIFIVFYVDTDCYLSFCLVTRACYLWVAVLKSRPWHTSFFLIFFFLSWCFHLLPKSTTYLLPFCADFVFMRVGCNTAWEWPCVWVVLERGQWCVTIY